MTFKMNKNKTLKEIKEEMESIAGSWNGKEAGRQEDRVHQANDILQACKNLEELLEEMKEL